MMRRDFATDSPSSTTELRAIVLAGTVGSGAALVADVIADVVKLSFGRLERRRQHARVGLRLLAVERLEIDPTAADRRRPAAGLAVVCDADGESIAAAIPADETVVVNDGVPAWRQSLLSTDSMQVHAGRNSIDVAARGVAIVSRRLPYDRRLWRRALARQVPKRFRKAALARFDAEANN